MPRCASQRAPMEGPWASRTLRGVGRGLLLVVALNTMAAAAGAQSDEQRAAARSLATDGATAFNEGRYKESVDYFTRAESLVHAPPHLLFAARGLEKLGLLVKAREHYLKVVKETLSPSAPQAFRDAQASAAQELAQIEPRIGSLTLRVAGAEQAKDVEVQVDGVPLPAVLIGVSRPTDPGEHRIVVSARGFKPVTESVRLNEGERKAITLTLAVDPNAATAAGLGQAPGAGTPNSAGAPLATDASGRPVPGTTATLDPVSSAHTSSKAQSLKIGSYVAFGVGAVGLGLGTVFLLNSRSKRSDADAAFAECSQSGDCRENDAAAQRTADLDDQARSAQTLSAVGFAVGALGVAAGTTLFVLGSRTAPQTGFVMKPYLALGRAGVTGAF